MATNLEPRYPLLRWLAIGVGLLAGRPLGELACLYVGQRSGLPGDEAAGITPYMAVLRRAQDAGHTAMVAAALAGWIATWLAERRYGGLVPPLIGALAAAVTALATGALSGLP